MANSNLPADKQYLITKGVPSLRRLKELQQIELEHGDELEKDADDGWVETFNIAGKQEQKGIQLEDEEEEVKKGEQKKAVIDLADSDDDEDENMFVEEKVETKQQSTDVKQGTKKVRKYDLSITYDFYTQTPRLWLTGYSEDGTPLTTAQIFEDIAAEQANKTVTMVAHPNTGNKEASIHPCNHAKVMKTIIDTVIANGGQPDVSQSMFVFLKFISSVIPTIQYDFTVDLELD